MDYRDEERNIEIKIPCMSLEEYVALELFISSDKNLFHLEGVKDVKEGDCFSGNPRTDFPHTTYYKLRIKSIGDIGLSEPKQRTIYYNVSVLVNSEYLPRKEFNRLMKYLHSPLEDGRYREYGKAK